MTVEDDQSRVDRERLFDGQDLPRSENRRYVNDAERTE